MNLMHFFDVDNLPPIRLFRHICRHFEQEHTQITAIGECVLVTYSFALKNRISVHVLASKIYCSTREFHIKKRVNKIFCSKNLWNRNVFSYFCSRNNRAKKCNMVSLIVKHFGPIVNAEGFPVDVHKVTAFCGSQGTGKSTIVKLISEFTWIEKALTRGDFLTSEVTGYDRFRKKYCAYHNIHNYFHDDTYIRYKGEKYIFEYKDKHLTIEQYNGHDYLRPQVMYIPAERNFMVAVEDAEKIKQLPSALSTMIGDYGKALRSSNGNIVLPVAGYHVQYDRLNKLTWLVGNGFKVRVQEAASGFQSLIPLIVVSQYLISEILTKDDSKNNRSSDSTEERDRIQKTIQKILQDKSLDDSMRRALILEMNANMRNQRFVNIVEEPEQNLFPTSQSDVLFKLLEINNTIVANSLILTTHSPYIINYLSLAIKAHNLLNRPNGQKYKEDIDKVVPLLSCVASQDVAVYEIAADGNIHLLPQMDGMPSDANYLNTALDDVNTLFDALLDIEDRLNND